jgi:ABC-type Fe3+-siderophore transport system permease subunit
MVGKIIITIVGSFIIALISFILVYIMAIYFDPPFTKDGHQLMVLPQLFFSFFASLIIFFIAILFVYPKSQRIKDWLNGGIKNK